jgi:deoxyadenosine/deoxycytidine kinase
MVALKGNFPDLIKRVLEKNVSKLEHIQKTFSPIQILYLIIQSEKYKQSCVDYQKKKVIGATTTSIEMHESNQCRAANCVCVVAI